MVFVLFLIELVFYFGDVRYFVDESVGYVEVRVWRIGIDLFRFFSVIVRFRKIDFFFVEGK